MAEEVPAAASFTPYVHSQTLTSHDRAVSSVKFSSDGRLLASVSTNKIIRTYSINVDGDSIADPRLWNISSGKFLKTYTGHVNSQYCISSAFSITNGKRIVIGSEDRCVYMWELNSRKMLQKLEGNAEPVMSVACHPTENSIASGSLDKSVRIWTQKKE